MNFTPMNRKTVVFFLTLLISIFCLDGIFSCLPAKALDDPLPSWNDGTNKTEIMAFVSKVTNIKSSSYVEPQDRIAVFDNDGTLWAERPQYFQLDFLEAQPEPLAKAKSQIKFSKLPKSTQKELDVNRDSKIDSDEILVALNDMAVFEDITTEEYINTAHDFVHNTNHQALTASDEKYERFDAEYIDLTYQPVIELVNYLKDNDFKVYICSGGGVDFVRSFAEDAYGIPPQEVIGSAIKTKFDQEFGGNLIRQPFLGQYNDKFGKPVGIERHIGKRPIIAVGNSGGDYQMFQYTEVGVDKSLIVLINHDDCDREYVYNNIPGDKDGEEPKNISLDEAQNRDNWKVVSMKEDFNTIFSSELPPRENLVCES